MGIETIAAIAAVGGTLLKAGSDLAKGRAEKQAGDYMGAVSDQRAASERDAAGAEAEDYFRREHGKLSGGRAARGGTGVTMEGSPLMVDEATVREIALGAQRIVHGGEVKGGRMQQEGELSRIRGRNAQTASYFAAGTSLLSGVARFGGQGISKIGDYA